MSRLAVCAAPPVLAVSSCDQLPLLLGPAGPVACRPCLPQDERIRVMSELLQHMRVIKMLAWEDIFERWVSGRAFTPSYSTKHACKWDITNIINGVLRKAQALGSIRDWPMALTPPVPI